MLGFESEEYQFFNRKNVAVKKSKPLSEKILEYDESVNAKVTLTIEEAENDAEIVNDGIKPEFIN